MRQIKVRFTHNVIIDRLSVSQKIAELTDRLEKEGRFTFTSMFRFFREGTAASPAEMRHEAVVTFLALLEMAKLRLIALSQQPEEERLPSRAPSTICAIASRSASPSPTSTASQSRE